MPEPTAKYDNREGEGETQRAGENVGTMYQSPPHTKIGAELESGPYAPFHDLGHQHIP